MQIRILAGLAVCLVVSTAPLAAQRSRPRFEPLNDPQFVPDAQADFLRDNDRVLGVSGNGVAKAYPAAVLAYHHIVHDRLGDLPILPTW